ncbi:small, acid-soluble spore protein, alpha/beta type [Clostridium sp. JNZ J1-5]|nr:small, acid-soluble spore protein, alpha/beta type [Clostridium sp.]
MKSINDKNIDSKAKDINIKSREELAKELGIEVPKDGYWGDTPSKLCGIVGGAGKKTK